MGGGGGGDEPAKSVFQGLENRENTGGQGLKHRG